MRVISGKARGTKLDSIESNLTRPTLDRVKESLFNILQSQVKDSIVVDLFAGSGALGIESLSRGAKKAYFCDKNIDAIKVIKKNLERTKLINNAYILCEDYKKFLKEINEKIDIIFIDPPYKDNLAVDAIKLIMEYNIISKDGIIAIETDEPDRDTKELKEIDGIKIVDQRKYGRANLIFIKSI